MRKALAVAGAFFSYAGFTILLFQISLILPIGYDTISPNRSHHASKCCSEQGLCATRWAFLYCRRQIQSSLFLMLKPIGRHWGRCPGTFLFLNGALACKIHQLVIEKSISKTGSRASASCAPYSYHPGSIAPSGESPGWFIYHDINLKVHHICIIPRFYIAKKTIFFNSM